jgi:two-component system, OmpR family, phosphate regulon sensor histidine kinase PhoR
VKRGVGSNLFLWSLAAVLVCVVGAQAYLSAALDHWLADRTRADLVVRLQLIEREASAFSASDADTSAWNALAVDLGGRAAAHLTIIRKDGEVVGNSHEASGSAENEAAQPEIAGALANGLADNVRKSGTAGERTLHVAAAIRRGGVVFGVARLSMPLGGVDRTVARATHVLTVALLVIAAVAVLMSILGVRLGMGRMRVLIGEARKMAGGAQGTDLRGSGGDEFSELARTLDQLAESLSRAVADLRKERDLLGGILDGMREGVLLVDRDGRVALANPALREMLLLPEDITGKWLFEAVRQPELKGLIDRARDSGEASSDEIETGGIAPRRLLVHAVAVAHEPGGLLAVLFDVTSLRRLESLRRDFVANVSHELRTPVAALRSASETLLGGAAADPQAMRDFVEIIDRNSARLQQLIEDLLDLARIEAREVRLDLGPVDIGAAATGVMALLREQADAKGIRLSADVPGDTARVRADRHAIDQVLTNLVDNAVKYCQRGARVSVTAAAEGDLVRVSVVDDGPGIEEKHQPRLFERFYRVDAGRSREVGGTGLGLAIVKHLVEAMGGTVSVQSTPGTGSAFSIVLPRV